ncbi:ribonuclease [Fulvimarina sp. 2208YS6-2-32]|uniref:Ribonuclease n=1 Tax=Fulvimarina uroteuthidis TaxID=3098149 RepID=A0ABU5HZK0_9HYPH|nr:ribonuclease [Fulvimarina sp. 2208YS6-2-32]
MPLPFRIAPLLAGFLLLATPSASVADGRDVPDERFVARAVCPLFQSFRNGTNPGNLSTKPGSAYAIIAVNGTNPTHYRLRVPGARPQERWVAMDCGGLASAAAAGARPTPDGGAAPPASRGADALANALASSSGGAKPPRRDAVPRTRSPAGTYVLAASWHAAFCEVRPRSLDCRGGGLDDGLKLHGLWPQPRDNAYCGVSRRDIETDRTGRWEDLPEPEIGAATARALQRAMPGMAADLHSHEWIKHGTCYGADADEYFADSLRLVEQLDASPVGRLFRSSRGRELTNDAIRSAFDDAFGPGAGERVLVDCNDDDGRRIVNELRINLKGEITPSTDLGALILSASTAPRGCPVGVVDRSGDQ